MCKFNKRSNEFNRYLFYRQNYILELLAHVCLDLQNTAVIWSTGVDSASNKNEYQEYFLGGKGGRCVGLTTLPPSCADCL
jgi:hypothetical protein